MCMCLGCCFSFITLSPEPFPLGCVSVCLCLSLCLHLRLRVCVCVLVGESIYGPTFEDETFCAKHSKRGMLAMANDGLHTNGSQFLVSFRALEWMNTRYVAFG